MTLQALAPLAIRFAGRVIQFEPGAVFTVTDNQAQRLLRAAPGKVRTIVLSADPPAEPLQPGWLVYYRDRRGVLCGGCGDREHGTVQACRLEGNGWTVHLTDGQRLSLSLIRSVGQTDAGGQLVAAWTVQEHGYDGHGSEGKATPSKR